MLFAAIDAGGLGHGAIFSVNNTAGIRKADGTLFRVGDPISTIESQNEADPTRIPLFGQVGSPRLEQPYTRQTNLGWAHQLSGSTAFTADVVHIDGRDLNVRFRPNYRDPATGLRRLADLDVRPNTQAIRLAINGGESQYDALILGIRRRMSDGVDFSASYTLSSATSNIGTASDELDANYVQDVTNPFADVQVGPSGRSDARHRISMSAVIHAPWGLQVAPFFLFRSALPVYTFEGVDLQRRQQQQRHHAEGVSIRRRGAGAEGDRRLQDHQLQPGRELLADEPADLEVVPACRAAHASKASRKSSTCSTPSTRRSR